MDPHAKGFDALERAFEAFNPQDRQVSPNLKRDTTQVQRKIPTTIATIPDSESDSDCIDEGIAPNPNANDHKTLEVSITPLLQQRQLVHQNSGLPPTPPTMANSDTAEERRTERAASPAPLFADRVRNALSHKSGFSTPVDVDDHSPPTPEASPPGRKENLLAPRPPLSHYPSSYADSFKTANEGLSVNGSTSRIHSPAHDFVSDQQQAWWMRAQPVRLAGLGLGLHHYDEPGQVENYDSDKSVVRHKTYALSSPEPESESESSRRAKQSSEPFPTFDASTMGSVEIDDDQEWHRSINPRVIEAALRPRPSQEMSHVRPGQSTHDIPLGNAKNEDTFEKNQDSVPASPEHELREMHGEVNESPSGNTKSEQAAEEHQDSPPEVTEAELREMHDEVIERAQDKETMEQETQQQQGCEERTCQNAKSSPKEKQGLFSINVAEVKRRWLQGQVGSNKFDLTDDSDRGEVRPKHYAMESDSDVEKTRPSSSEDPPSPTWRKALHHRAAFQKLRKPIQPGEDAKRPDEFMLYAPSIPWKPSQSRAADTHRDPDRSQTPPKREQDSEFLRNADPAAVDTPDSLKEVILPCQISQPMPKLADRNINMPDLQDTAREAHDFAPSENSADVVTPPTPGTAPLPSMTKLREFTPSVPPAGDPSPPTTAAKESLENNNRVYRAIQEENAKRHSLISDGSGVPAVVLPLAEHKRKLRHTSKRESLRADVSMGSGSKPHDDDGGHARHRLRHKRGMDSISGGNDSTFATPSERSERRVRTEPIKLSSRISQIDGSEPVVEYISSSPAPKDVADSIPAKPRLSQAPGELLSSGLKPRKLRRSSRENALDKHSLSLDPNIELVITPATKLRKFSREERLDKNFDVVRTSLYSETEAKTPELRRFSKEERLENNQNVRRTSLGRESQLISHDMDLRLRRLAQDLTVGVRELNVPEKEKASSSKDRRSSSENPTSPRRKSFDPRHHNPNVTPLSTSQFSERTAMTEAEVGLARGVEIHQHNNDSLLLIHGILRPEDEDGTYQDVSISAIDEDGEVLSPDVPIASIEDDNGQRRAGTPPPTFKALVESPATSAYEIGRARHSVDSPLTNPRAAPVPPVIQFIPPTPSEELERELSDDRKPKSKPGLQRDLSWSQKVRRYSEHLIQPLPFGRNGSIRRREPKRMSTMPEQRPQSLSPMWQPRDFWEQFSDSEDDDGYGDHDPLPPGGDTSDVAEKPKSFLPRNMSVRLPGFRGNGGFLIGNSIGLDRHGTNNRRHYVERCTSEEMLQRAMDRRKRRTLSLPFSGKQVEYVGLDYFSARYRDSRQRKQERAAEKRREKLRGQIGTRMYHDGG